MVFSGLQTSPLTLANRDWLLDILKFNKSKSILYINSISWYYILRFSNIYNRLFHIWRIFSLWQRAENSSTMSKMVFIVVKVFGLLFGVCFFSGVVSAILWYYSFDTAQVVLCLFVCFNYKQLASLFLH